MSVPIRVVAIWVVVLLPASYCLGENSPINHDSPWETRAPVSAAASLQELLLNPPGTPGAARTHALLIKELTLPLVLAERADEAAAEPADDAEKSAEKVAWTGSVEAGIQIREGNTESTDMYGKVKALRASDKRELSLGASYDYAELEGETNTNRAFAECGYRLYQWERAYLFGVINAEHDEIEDLDLRLNASAGPGYKFIHSEKTKLIGEVGVGATAEWYDSRETGSEQKTEGILRLHGEWTTKVFDRSTFSQVLTVLPSVTDIGTFKLVSDTSLTTPLSQKLDLRVSVHDEYDSDPEVSGVEKNDLTFRTTLVFTF